MIEWDKRQGWVGLLAVYVVSSVRYEKFELKKIRSKKGEINSHFSSWILQQQCINVRIVLLFLCQVESI